MSEKEKTRAVTNLLAASYALKALADDLDSGRTWPGDVERRLSTIQIYIRAVEQIKGL